MTLTPRKHLEILTAWDREPQLSSDELDALLEMFQKADAAGVSPGGDGYTPTYNMRAAAREGWKWKAAKAAEMISTDLDGDRMSANQLYNQCQDMVRKFSGTASPVTAVPSE